MMKINLKFTFKRFLLECSAALFLFLFILFAFQTTARAATVSTAPEESSITVTNNAAGTSDTVYVSDLSYGDTVKIYTASSSGKLLAKGTLSSSASSLTIKITQLGATSGSVYISITSSGCTESSRTEAKYEAEPVSDAPDAGSIVVTNNAVGTADTISVSDLKSGDVIKVYNAAAGGKLLARGTVVSASGEITFKVSQLGAAAGSIFVSVSNTGCLESSRTEVKYDAEQSTSAHSASYITIKNNPSGTNDTIYISGLGPGDIVKIYTAEIGGKVLAKGTVSTNATDITLKITQLGSSAGSIFITVTNAGYLESARTEVEYDAEPDSDAPDSKSITISNNASGTSDTIYISGLSAKDVVKVYNASTGGKLLASGTVSSSSGDITIKIAQLSASAGSVYITVTSSGCTESSRTKADFIDETTTETLDSALITITNNPKGTADTITVNGLDEGDTIKVYSAETGGKLLGSATVARSMSSVTINVTQLGSDADSVYITRKTTTSLESSRTEAKFSAEAVSNAPAKSDIIITNNPKGTSDTIYLQNLNIGDIVKVYSAATGGTLLAKATAISSDTTISLTQLGATSGTVYISVTSSTMNESARTEADYDAEAVTTAPVAGNISITNNPAGTSDTISVSGLNTNDVVKVYNSSGALLGKATVTSGTTVTITITQLGSAEGSLFVSLTSTGKVESARTEAAYSAEAVSTAPDDKAIIVTNNAAPTSDTVYVSGLKASDIVTVYQTAKKGTPLGTATVAPGASYATVSITQLATGAGSVFVTVTSPKSLESSCTEASYSAEAISDAPSADKIIVTNNVTGTADTVYMTGLSEGDIVKVYDKAVQGTVLGSATVSSSTSSAGSCSLTITVNQLGTDAGSVYVSITKKGKTESPVTQSKYIAETLSAAPSEDNIVVTNNAGTSDTVYVSGLSGGDIVNVYKNASKGTKLGTATVAASASAATVSITQLGSDAGDVFISVTKAGALESSLTKVSYSGESATTALDSDAVCVTNNYKSTDTVVVPGLSTGDVINVYDAAAGGSLLGTATVIAPSTTATVSISQLGSSSGSIYVTKTSKNLAESARTAVRYLAEPVSAAPGSGNVTILNNAGASDTITVIGLKAGDIVTVYKSSSESNTWGNATVTASSSSLTISVAQLGSAAGKVYISITSMDAAESSRSEVDYPSETQSTSPSADNVTVNNNYNIKSTVAVTGLSGSDIVNVYSASSGGTLLGTGTVSANGNSVVISLSGLNALGGKIYLTVTSTNCSESTRSAVTYSAQTVSTAPQAADVTIVNNAALSDTVTLKGLNIGTIVNVYDAASAGTLLGSATAASSASTVVSIDQLGKGTGSVYVTLTTSGKTESARTQVTYAAESASAVISAGNVTIVNYAGAADTISITGLSSGDVVRVYKDSSITEPLASSTASGNLSTTLTIQQLGVSSGSVYLTVTTSGKTESGRTAVTYVAESKSPLVSNVSVVNNAAISDSIAVSGLTTGDTVNIYSDSAGKVLIGTASVSSNSTAVTISVTQLSTSAGYLYITITNSGCAESALTKISYLAEQTTDAPADGDIYIVNNATGTPDTVTVYNLSSGDVVKVYDTSANLLGKVTASGTSAVVSISDLGSTEGNVSVTKTSRGKNESDDTSVSYAAESQSAAPYVGNVSVANNVALSDTIVVTGLNAGNLVKVYVASSNSYQCIGYTTVLSGSTSATISISQLGAAAGTIYVSVTESGKTESPAIAVDYPGESQSNSVILANVAIVNNPSGTSDTITVSGLHSGDVIQVFDQAANGNLLGTAVATSSGTVTINVRLGESAGSVYVSCTTIGKSESELLKINYAAE